MTTHMHHGDEGDEKEKQGQQQDEDVLDLGDIGEEFLLFPDDEGPATENRLLDSWTLYDNGNRDEDEDEGYGTPTRAPGWQKKKKKKKEKPLSAGRSAENLASYDLIQAVEQILQKIAETPTFSPEQAQERPSCEPPLTETTYDIELIIEWQDLVEKALRSLLEKAEDLSDEERQGAALFVLIDEVVEQWAPKTINPLLYLAHECPFLYTRGPDASLLMELINAYLQGRVSEQAFSIQNQLRSITRQALWRVLDEHWHAIEQERRKRGRGQDERNQ